jgi:ABC-type transport system involved in multi-copper enzyme maturation permease subunit
VTRLLPDNPVLTKELRVRMRGARAYWILLAYLGFLSIVMIVSYASWSSQIRESGSGGSGVSKLGNDIFMILLICQVFLVLFITPAITSGSITLEKEQQTLDMLTMTRLSRGSMVAGKLLSAVSFTALLLISSLPLVSICFMLGSIDPAMVLSTYLEMLMGSFLIGAVGMMWSSIAKTTTVAVLLTYVSMLILSIGIYLLYMLYRERAYTGNLGAIGGAFQAISVTWFGETFLGLKGLEGTGFALLSLLTGLLLAAIAMSRLETWPDRKAGLLRGLTLFIVALQTLAVNLWWLNNWYARGTQAIQVVVVQPIGALIVTTMLLMLLVPTFATGEVHPFEARKFGKYLLGGWTLKGLKRGKLASGLSFVILLTLLSIGLYALSFVLVGKADDLMHTANASQAVTPPPLPGGPVIGPGPGPITMRAPNMPSQSSVPAPPAAFTSQSGLFMTTGDFPQAALVVLSSVVGFSLICLFLSVAFRNRWVAWMLAYLFLLMVLILPPICQTALNNDEMGMFGRVFVNLAYFNPIHALAQMTDPAGYWSQNSLILSPMPMWAVTTFTWVVVGSLCCLLTLPYVVRQAKVNAPIPFEEMVAEA